jgi:hypothetical protein
MKRSDLLPKSVREAIVILRDSSVEDFDAILRSGELLADYIESILPPDAEITDQWGTVVICIDSEKPDQHEAQMVRNDYVVVTDGDCYVDRVVPALDRSTHTVVIKGRS